MDARSILMYVLIAFSMPAFAQESWCDAGSKLKSAKENGNYELFLQGIRDQHNSMVSSRSEIFLPVVVHVVTRPGVPVISYAQVIHQIDVLNNDFAGRGENIPKLAEEFEHLAADTDIRFCLASIDPNGNPTNGITYTMTDVSNIALQTEDQGRISVHYDQYGGKSFWNTDRYINIWVAEYGTGILGSSSMPGSAPFPEEEGIVMDLEHFGSIGTATHSGFFNRGHTLTHEMGHYLGLLHIWGDEDDSCTDTDEIDDTPNAEGPYLDCPEGDQISCGENNMYQNFMDLTDDRCLAAFTHGQAMRMKTVIDLYYPDLSSSIACQPSLMPFNAWWDALSWSYDVGSYRYIMYSPSTPEGEIIIDVFSADGRLLQHDVLHDQYSYLINLDNASAGVYFIRVMQGEESRVRKVVAY